MVSCNPSTTYRHRILWSWPWWWLSTNIAFYIFLFTSGLTFLYLSILLNTLRLFILFCHYKGIFIPFFHMLCCITASNWEIKTEFEFHSLLLHWLMGKYTWQMYKYIFSCPSYWLNIRRKKTLYTWLANRQKETIAYCG